MIRDPRTSEFEFNNVTLSIEMVVEMFDPLQNIPQHALYFNAFHSILF